MWLKPFGSSLWQFPSNFESSKSSPYSWGKAGLCRSTCRILYKEKRQGISACLIMILVANLSDLFKKYDSLFKLYHHFWDSKDVMSLSEPLIPFHGVAGCCCWSQSQPCLWWDSLMVSNLCVCVCVCMCVSQCLARATSDGALSQTRSRGNVRPCLRLLPQCLSVQPSAVSMERLSRAASRNYRSDDKIKHTLLTQHVWISADCFIQLYNPTVSCSVKCTINLVIY